MAFGEGFRIQFWPCSEFIPEPRHSEVCSLEEPWELKDGSMYAGKGDRSIKAVSFSLIRGRPGKR